MAASGRSILQRAALKSGLVTKNQLDEALAVARQPAVGPPTPLLEITDDQLARQLVDMGLVTEYQVHQLKAGNTRFTLGPYLVTDFVDEGGMGQVYKAEHQVMGRKVAIKVLPQHRSTPNAIANFSREIRAQAILDHPNLVRALDAGHDGKVHFLVTEFIDGSDLRRLVRNQGPATVQQAASIISQAARGLQCAHEKGLIHRDVKPGNILVTADGHAKVVDLGLASFLSKEFSGGIATRVVGTPDFISPEQYKEPESISPASDIYSLGCTLYYLITGKVPYPGGKTKDKLRRHCEETPWHPRRFNSQVTDDFVDVIADMMEKDPAKRIQTCQEVIARLEPWATELAPMPEPHDLRSPWTPPPVPHDSSGGSSEDLQPTQEGSYDVDLEAAAPHAPTRGAEQNTDPVASALEETQRDSDSRQTSPPPLPIHQEHLDDHGWNQILIALAVAIPVSMLIGALVTLVLKDFWK